MVCRKRSCAVGALSLLLLMVLVGGKCGSYGNFRGELDACLGPLLSGDGVTPAPVWLSEFGTDVRDNYFNNIIRYMKENKLDFAYWSINGEKRSNESETYGLLQQDVRGEVTGVVLPVLAALAGWLAVPFLTGNQYEYFPIIATFIAGYGVIVLEDSITVDKTDLNYMEKLFQFDFFRDVQEQTEINKAATALVLGVLVWALVGTGVDMSAANFDTAIKETLEDVSEVVFFLLGALTIVEIMDAHKGAAE
eukprot:g23692.t1